MHTGEIHQSPAGYKKGGHVSHKASHHAEGGHVHMHEHVAKHFSGGHEKMKAHPMKKGGKACNW
jgi:hypothetical protein